MNATPDMFKMEATATAVPSSTALTVVPPEPEQPAPEPDDEFKWSPENPDIVMPEQQPVAVYLNRWNQAVIRQQSADPFDEDDFVIISLNNLPAVIRALQELLPVDRKRS